MPVDVRFPSKEVQEAVQSKKTWEDYRSFRGNIKYFVDNLDKIRKDHAGKTIIVHDGDIIFSSMESDKIREKIKSFPSVNQAYIVYVPKEHEIDIL